MRVFLLAICLGGALGACRPATTPTAQSTAKQVPTPTGAPTIEDARTAVRRYVGTQPDSALYQLGSASVLDADTSWQVLVPRTDWANRMPNRAAFDVNKASGVVTRRAVK